MNSKNKQIAVLGMISFLSLSAYAQCDSTCMDLPMPIFNWNMTTEVATRPKTPAPPPPAPATTLIPQPPAPAAYVPPAGWVPNCIFDSNNYVAKNVFSTTVVNEGNTIYNHNYVVSAIEPPFNTAYVRNGNIIELIGALNTNNVAPQYGARTYHQGPVQESGSFPTRPNVNGPIAMKTSGAWSVHSICNHVEPPPPPPPVETFQVSRVCMEQTIDWDVNYSCHNVTGTNRTFSINPTLDVEPMDFQKFVKRVGGNMCPTNYNINHFYPSLSNSKSHIQGFFMLNKPDGHVEFDEDGIVYKRDGVHTYSSNANFGPHDLYIEVSCEAKPLKDWVSTVPDNSVYFVKNTFTEGSRYGFTLDFDSKVDNDPLVGVDVYDILTNGDLVPINIPMSLSSNVTYTPVDSYPDVEVAQFILSNSFTRTRFRKRGASLTDHPQFCLRLRTIVKFSSGNVHVKDFVGAPSDTNNNACSKFIS